MSLSTLTLQNIADVLGISKMSVSRALANKPGVSKELRQKILELAQEHKYRPNPLITALMTNLRVQRSHRSGVRDTVLAFIERGDQADEVRREHFSGASRTAHEQGYKLEPFVIGKVGLKPSRVNEILLARNIPGMIIAPLPQGHGHFVLEWSQFCVVAIEYTFSNPIFDHVVHDSYSSMRIILQKCRARGFGRIGLLFSANGRERTEGLNEAAYWMEQKTTGTFSAIPPLCLEKWNERSVLKWIKQYKPEVIIRSSEFWSLLNTLLAKCRIRVPEDCSIININAVHSNIDSGIDQNNDVMGAAAGQLLIDKINRNDRGIPVFPKTILTPGKWIEGHTLIPPAPTPVVGLV